MTMKHDHIDPFYIGFSNTFAIILSPHSLSLPGYR